MTRGQGAAGDSLDRQAIETARAIRGPLLRWYRRNRRDLPWRRTRDPYAIWVSEVMLQQTRVAAAEPYYRRFLERFPDVETLARSSEEEVLGLWSGLGYYRRARMLLQGAREVLRRHGGAVPSDPAALRALPGIGRYTAGAIASIAFDLREPVLDGNVRRVICRVLGLRGDEPGAGPGGERLWAVARELASGPSPGDRNQALMELGALTCTPRSPSCRTCPIARCCAARAGGRPEEIPRSGAKRPVESVRVLVAVLARGGRVLLERPGPSSPLRGSWDLPAREISEGREGPGERFAASLLAEYGLVASLGERIHVVGHSILHRRMTLEIHQGRLTKGRVASHDRLRWLDPADLDTAPVSGATRKALLRVSIRPQ